MRTLRLPRRVGAERRRHGLFLKRPRLIRGPRRRRRSSNPEKKRKLPMRRPCWPNYGVKPSFRRQRLAVVLGRRSHIISIWYWYARRNGFCSGLTGYCAQIDPREIREFGCKPNDGNNSDV